METAEWQSSDEAVSLCTEYTKVHVGLVHFATHEEGRFLSPPPGSSPSSPGSELFQAGPVTCGHPETNINAVAGTYELMRFAKGTDE